MKKVSDTTSKTVKSEGSSPTGSELIYFIKRPSAKRKSWAIASFKYDENRKRIYFPFEDERVQSINKKFKDGTIDHNAANVMLEEIIDGLYKRNKNLKMVFRRQVLTEENEKLLNEFWDEVYESKLLADERSAKDDFLRAFKLIKEKSIYTSSAKDLTKELKTNCSGPNQHRRAADRLNEVLRYLKRDIVLAKPPEAFKRVKYLNEKEVFALTKQAPSDELKWLVLTLFGTGARLGEAMALTPNDIGNGDVYIEKQLTEKNEIKEPKRGKKGVVPVIPSTKDAIKKWATVENKESYRDSVYEFITRTSRKLWAGDKMKWVSPHDLRHSYAIYCLSKGHSLGMVANSLRNRIEVCQKYYTGYAHNTDTLEAAKKMLA